MTTKKADLRVSYKVDHLTEHRIAKDPIRLFAQWFDSALEADILESNAMTLATADEDGRPAARMVLLKSFNKKGFVFYTNYLSRKGLQLAGNPYAALVFWWGVFTRQIRIEGRVEKISGQESDEYFNSRPRGHQLSAVISDQSKPVPNYEHLEKRFSEVSKSLEEKNIPRPEFWGGYRVKPELMEFWQGRPNRLHDRFRYTKQKSGKWLIERLAP